MPEQALYALALARGWPPQALTASFAELLASGMLVRAGSLVRFADAAYDRQIASVLVALYSCN